MPIFAKPSRKLRPKLPFRIELTTRYMRENGYPYTYSIMDKGNNIYSMWNRKNTAKAHCTWLNFTANKLTEKEQ